MKYYYFIVYFKLCEFIDSVITHLPELLDFQLFKQREYKEVKIERGRMRKERERDNEEWKKNLLNNERIYCLPSRNISQHQHHPQIFCVVFSHRHHRQFN